MHADGCDGDRLDQRVDVIVDAWNCNVIPWWLLLPLAARIVRLPRRKAAALA